MKRIDDSHQPFKRTGRIGPGPRKRAAVFESKTYSCKRASPTATHYVQVCTYFGADGKKHTTKVKLKKAYKKRYNKVYRAWAKTNKRVTALAKRGAKPGYRCKRTAQTKCR